MGSEDTVFVEKVWSKMCEEVYEEWDEKSWDYRISGIG